MTDLRTQRNLAIGAGAVILAVLLGFLLGRGGREVGASRPEVGQPSTAVTGSNQPAGAPPAEVEAGGAPVATAETAPARPARRPAASPAAPAVEPERPAGERWTQTAEPPNAPAPADPEPAAPAPRATETLTVPDGTQISLALTSPLSSQSSQVGDPVVAELTEAVAVDGRVALPAGTRVTGRVTLAEALKKIGGRARLAFSFETALVDGRELPIAAHFAREGKSETGKDAATIAAGTAIGIILGNQAKKNDRGKVIGGVVGAAAGTGIAAATKGETIELPGGTELRLTLRGPVTVTR